MRLKRLVIGGIILCAGVTALRAQQEFSILAVVTDPATGDPVETLDAADVNVTEDSVAGQVVRIETINRVVKVQLLIDNGLGIGPTNIGQLRRALRGLIEALPPDVETTLITTAPQPRTVVRPTTNREELLRASDRLAPDSGPGRFVEGLGEAAERAERESDKAFTVLIAAATTSGDLNVRDRDIERLFERVQGHPVIVHVAMFAGGTGRSASGGTVQTDVGLALTEMTGGRFETVNSMNGYVGLMAELGADVAKQASGLARQFRIIVRRPEGKSGDLGKLSISVANKAVPSVTLEQR